MAIYAPSESPAVVTREIDLTNGVPNVPTSTGAIVGDFRWGPCNEPILVNNEGTLVATFGTPDTTTTVDFHSASYYLRYSNDLYVIRGMDSDTGKNAFENGPISTYTNATIASTTTVGGSGAAFNVTKQGATYTVSIATPGVVYLAAETFTIAGTTLGGTSPTNDIVITVTTVNVASGAITAISHAGVAVDPAARFAPTVENQAEFEATQSALDSDTHTFIAKYPGSLGNSLKIEICGSNHADPANPSYHTDFDAWAFKNNFDTGPGTSAHTANIGGKNDEVHVAIVDALGELSGTKGTVLETYPYISQAKGCQNADGTNNYIVDVINSRSRYVKLINLPTGMGTGAGAVATSTSDMKLSAQLDVILVGGVNGNALGTDDWLNAYTTIEDTNQYLIDFLIAPSLDNKTHHATLVNNLVTIAAQTRKDCMVFASPNREAVVNNRAGANADILLGVANFTRSSYLCVDNNFLKVYDKYNDNYIHIPAASSTAGLCAATDNNFAPWVSPAGTRRGQYFGVTALSYNPNKSQRDQLYRAGINPITNMPGQGILLFGDKTHLARPSAFDRINVRRLFLVIERAIAEAAKNILFEFNDEFTRAEFVNIIEPLLRDIKGRRGITDFRLVADATNNTPEIIDTNQFVANLFIKPARSINFITLNFVAVRTGVSFEEVVGQAT